jgi:hypothetical protein
MTDHEFSQRLKRIEESLQGDECRICPYCGYGTITEHQELTAPNGSIYYEPPLPEPCSICAQWQRKAGDIIGIIDGTQGPRED